MVNWRVLFLYEKNTGVAKRSKVESHLNTFKDYFKTLKINVTISSFLCGSLKSTLAAAVKFLLLKFE